MTRIEEMVAELRALPVEARVQILNAAMESLNPSDPERERRWGAEARRRLDAFRAGKLDARDGEEVFARLLAK